LNEQGERSCHEKNSGQKKCGPEPETLKLNGDWRELINKSFRKKRPANRWPK
jgi:hypothetical protein